MQNADRRLEPRRADRRDALAEQNGLEEGQGGVRHVHGWLPRPEGELQVVRHEPTQCGEVRGRGRALKTHHLLWRATVTEHSQRPVHGGDSALEVADVASAAEPLEDHDLLADLRLDDATAEHGCLRGLAEPDLPPQAICAWTRGGEFLTDMLGLVIAVNAGQVLLLGLFAYLAAGATTRAAHP